MKPEEKSEIILWDWFKTKGEYIKEIYFNRKNLLNWKVFTTTGINKKPDFIIKIDRGYGIEYIAIEIKNAEKSRDVHDSGKILMYYENYISGMTKYFIEGIEIKINHFATATEFSKLGRLFKEDNQIISNTNSSDNWRKINAQLNLIPEYEFNRTSDYLRRLWAEWRNLRKRLEFTNAPSIGIIISNPTKEDVPYIFTMIYTSWLQLKSWKQRFWRL